MPQNTVTIMKRIRQLLKYWNVDVEQLVESNAMMKEMLEERSALEELGILAASIEHDIRNPLEVINSEIAMMERRFQADPTIRAHLAKIEEQKDRIYASMKIISLLRAHESYYEKSMSKTNINDLIHRCVKAIKVAMNTANIVFKLDEHARVRDLFVSAYSPLLQQAIINILKNSVEAIHEAGHSGLISTKLSRGKDDASRYVRIEISDNGPGIPAVDVSKLTVLSSSRTDARLNRGIGLFITNRIIHFHKGRLEIHSSAEEGTRVTLLLPKHD